MEEKALILSHCMWKGPGVKWKSQTSVTINSQWRDEITHYLFVMYMLSAFRVQSVSRIYAEVYDTMVPFTKGWSNSESINWWLLSSLTVYPKRAVNNRVAVSIMLMCLIKLWFNFFKSLLKIQKSVPSAQVTIEHHKYQKRLICPSGQDLHS